MATEHGYRAHIRTRARDWDRRAAPLHVFGGRPLLDAELPISRLTGRPLFLAFDFDLSDPLLAPLAIHSVRRLAILTSYGAELRADAPLFVKHHDGGRRLEILAEPEGAVLEDIPELPQLPVELAPLSEAEAGMETIDEIPDGMRPVHQLGGHPTWVTRAVVPPACPVTGEPMRFIAAVDSIRRFPLGDSEVQLQFGNDGMFYVFWSEAASISAGLTQSW